MNRSQGSTVCWRSWVSTNRESIIRENFPAGSSRGQPVHVDYLCDEQKRYIQGKEYGLSVKKEDCRML